MRFIILLFIGITLELASCQTSKQRTLLVYGLKLRSFTKFPIDTQWVKYNEPLFAIQKSESFLRDWRESIRAADTISPKDFAYKQVRLCLELSGEGRRETIYIEWMGRRFAYDGKAYVMTSANAAVLKKYFPNSARKVLSSELQKRGNGRYGYHKRDYLPDRLVFKK